MAKSFTIPLQPLQWRWGSASTTHQPALCGDGHKARKGQGAGQHTHRQTHTEQCHPVLCLSTPILARSLSRSCRGNVLLTTLRANHTGTGHSPAARAHPAGCRHSPAFWSRGWALSCPGWPWAASAAAPGPGSRRSRSWPLAPKGARGAHARPRRFTAAFRKPHLPRLPSGVAQPSVPELSVPVVERAALGAFRLPALAGLLLRSQPGVSKLSLQNHQAASKPERAVVQGTLLSCTPCRYWKSPLRLGTLEA